METFEVDPMVKIKEMEAKISALEAGQKYDAESALKKVNATLTAAKNDFKNADLDGVIAGLEVQFLKTGRHATPEEVRDAMKRSHEHVAKFIPRNEPPKVELGVVGASRSATPPATGTPPSATPPEKTHRDLTDIDGIMADYEAFKKG